MKSIVIYYSFSGNTRKVTDVLSEALKQNGESETIELKDLEESGKFFIQAGRAFWHKKAKIAQVKTDLSSCDLVCLGTPVWAFGPAPAMNTYLEKATGLENKNVILFTTYGSGTGNSRCLDYMQGILTRKGARGFQRFSIQQFKVNERELVLSKIRPLLLKAVEK